MDGRAQHHCYHSTCVQIEHKILLPQHLSGCHYAPHVVDYTLILNPAVEPSAQISNDMYNEPRVSYRGRDVPNNE